MPLQDSLFKTQLKIRTIDILLEFSLFHLHIFLYLSRTQITDSSVAKLAEALSGFTNIQSFNLSLKYSDVFCITKVKPI